MGTAIRAMALTVFIALLAGNSWASPGEAVNWDRESASALARSVDYRTQVTTLYGLTVAGSTSSVLDGLENIRNRSDWPAPARDAAIFSFTEELRSLPASSVPVEVITYLKAYEPSTFVPHEDHPNGAVPLFNIGSAAAGVENEWLREEATVEGLALLSSHPRALADAYILDQHPSARLGYLVALERASDMQLTTLVRNSTRRLKTNPELTPVAGRAALLSGDASALSQVLAQGEGPELAHLMRGADTRFSDSDNADILRHVLDHGSSSSASLAIAELGGPRSGQSFVRDLLFDRLAHPELGSSIALTLARDGSADTLAELTVIAQTGEGLGAINANLALDIHQTQFSGSTGR